MEKLLSQLLNLQSESEIVEFKEAKRSFDPQKLGKYFSALSNEANLQGVSNAWIVFGVNDKREVVGTSYRQDTAQLNELKAFIANHTNNRITFQEIYEVEHPNGRVVLFQIPSALTGMPTAWKGHYYGRDGEQLNALNLEELERIRNQTHLDWSANICDDATISDLSSTAIVQARKLYQEKHPHLANEIDAWDDKTFLNKAKLLIKGKITNTAILLLGKPESTHFVQPAVPIITWILKDRDNIAKDYQHFSCPLLLSVQEVFNKIRILKYRYMQKSSLFPEEVDQYDPFVIREALNNCIVHQDYQCGGKVNVVEREDDCLIFTNEGQFIPKTIEAVLHADAPESLYRNPFLANAMVNLKLIDTIGSGILRMFTIQKNKYFPLPEYKLDNNRVEVSIMGKVLDINYAHQLARKPDLSLNDIILLDSVQKKKELTHQDIKYLKSKKFIEGRKPNFHISSSIAKETGLQDDYMKMKGIDDDYCKKIIVEYLTEFHHGNRAKFENILLDRLPDILNNKQKKNKIKNALQSLKKQGIIRSEGKSWYLKKS